MTKGSDTKTLMVRNSHLDMTALSNAIIGNRIVRKTTLKPSNFKDKRANAYCIFSKIDSKTIVDYDCEGVISKNNKQEIMFYITDAIPVSLNQVFEADTKNISKGLKPRLDEKLCRKQTRNANDLYLKKEVKTQ